MHTTLLWSDSLLSLLFTSLLVGCVSAGGLPDAAIDHNRVGAESLTRGELNDAEANFRLALEYHPRFAEPHANLGLVMLRRDDLDAAEDHLRTAVQLNSDFDEAWSNLGVVLLHRGDREGAIGAFEKALAIDPGLVEARRNLAETWMALDRWAEARAQLMRLLQQTRDEPRARAAGLLAYCELRLGRTHAARTRADDSLRDRPDQPIARVVRGILHAQAGRFRSAIADLSLAERDPLVGFHARLRLAAIHLARGNRDDARPRIAELRREAPTHEAVALLVRALETP